MFEFRTVAVAAVVLLGLGSGGAQALYDVEPGEIPGRPGTLIRIWPLEGGAPGVRGGAADAFRILYRSTSPSGQTIPVSGAIYIPSVRAARDMPNSGATNRFAVWGHSQGGHAALYTGEIAARYAPELKLVGVAAAAPATYLVELFDSDESTSQDLVAMSVLSWTRLEDVPVATLVEPDAMLAFERTAKDCLESVSEFEKIETDESPLKHTQFLKVNPAKAEPWRGIMQHNTPGQAPAGAPVFIAQGTADTTVNPAITKRFGEALCAQGVRVSFMELPGVTHTFAARDSANAALSWMTERFREAPAPSSCER